MLGMAHHVLTTRVHNDKLGAVLHSLFEIGRCNWMIGSRARTDNDHAIGFHRISEGCRNSPGTNAFQQCRDRRSMAEPRTMVDIVGLKTLTDELLEQIGLFV